MKKTKFRSLGIGFLLSALLLALVTIAWPFVPESLKSQLNGVNLPMVTETTTATTVAPTSETTTQMTTTTDQEETTAAQAEGETTTSGDAASSNDGPVSITVSEGDMSYDVALKLQEAGAITNADEFATWLREQGIDNLIWAGTHEIQPNSTYEDIARALGALQ